MSNKILKAIEMCLTHKPITPIQHFQFLEMYLKDPYCLITIKDYIMNFFLETVIKRICCKTNKIHQE